MTVGSSLRAPILSRVPTYGHGRGVAVCSLYPQMGRADRHAQEARDDGWDSFSD